MKLSNITRILVAFVAILLLGVESIRGGELALDFTLPVATTSTNVSSITVPVTTSGIDPDDHIVYFEAQFTYDSSKIDIPSSGASNAGLTSDTGLWDVYGANIGSAGSIKTYVIWAYSYDWDNAFLHGSGTLMNLHINIVTGTGGLADLTVQGESDFGYWYPDPDNPENLESYPTTGNNGRITILCLTCSR